MSIYLEGAGNYDEDAILVERFVAGEKTAFEDLYHKYYNKVFSLAKGVMILEEEAIDVTQEVFALVYRNLHRFNRQAKFSTWLFRITINRSIQESRKRRFKHKHVELIEAAESVAPEAPEHDDPRIQAAMEKLTPQDRAIIILFYWQEQTLQEIAESMDINLNAAKTRLYRARERFRTFFEKETGHDS
ncbi:MAG: sigma-70 family RNA polymerase sigma factor [Armatimonadetes bacterium]|nr:sigma-70 family RNA polymerase sigma factor [Armatimonadota bacterium]MBS1725757.1 sigma-70 family RNA polymerase sigma factor [Armatimonadota bacterium]